MPYGHCESIHYERFLSAYRRYEL